MYSADNSHLNIDYLDLTVGDYYTEIPQARKHLAKGTLWEKKSAKFCLTLEGKKNPQQALETVQRFITKYKDVVFPTFQTAPPEALQKLIKTHIIIGINGKALCLCDEYKINGIPSKILDKHFGEELLIEPVLCSRGHALEKARAMFWKQHRDTDLCPHGEDHRIGEKLEVDGELLIEIGYYQETQKTMLLERKKILEDRNELSAELNKTKESLIESNRQLQVKNKELKESISKIEESNTALQASNFGTTKIRDEHKQTFALIDHKTVTVVTAATKVGVKASALCSTTIIRHIPVAAKFLGPNVVSKVLPCAGLAIGTSMAIHRLAKGEHLLAVLEMTSGLLSGIGMFTGGSTTIMSLGLDALILAIDVVECTNPKLAISTNSDDVVKAAHNFLGLDSKEKLTKEEVDKAYKQKMLLVHPDKTTRREERQEDIDIKSSAGQTSAYLQQARNHIYKRYGWSDSNKNK